METAITYAYKSPRLALAVLPRRYPTSPAGMARTSARRSSTAGIHGRKHGDIVGPTYVPSTSLNWYFECISPSLQSVFLSGSSFFPPQNGMVTSLWVSSKKGNVTSESTHTNLLDVLPLNRSDGDVTIMAGGEHLHTGRSRQLIRSEIMHLFGTNGTLASGVCSRCEQDCAPQISRPRCSATHRLLDNICRGCKTH